MTFFRYKRAVLIFHEAFWKLLIIFQWAAVNWLFVKDVVDCLQCVSLSCHGNLPVDLADDGAHEAASGCPNKQELVDTSIPTFPMTKRHLSDYHRFYSPCPSTPHPSANEFCPSCNIRRLSHLTTSAAFTSFEHNKRERILKCKVFK